MNQKAARRVTGLASVIIGESEEPRLASVSPIPRTLILLPGETTVLSAIAFDQNGRELDSITYNWQVVDPAVGTVNSTGIFRASFTEGSYPKSVLVVAKPPPGLGFEPVESEVDVIVQGDTASGFPTTIRPIPAVAEVEPGQTIKLDALLTDAKGALIQNVPLVWEMADPSAGVITATSSFTASNTPGTRPNAIKISAPPGEGFAGIETQVDVVVLSTEDLASPVKLAIIPQAVSLRPGEQIDFNAIALDQRSGERLATDSIRWRILNPAAGELDAEGHFHSSETPGVYQDAVEASLTLTQPDGSPSETITARATVAILDTSSLAQPDALDRIAIYPNEVVLSPGESRRLIIVGLGKGRPLSDLDVRWSLRPELGEVTPFVEVKAGKTPGIYPDAIHAAVTLTKGNGATETREITAALTIRGVLDNVTIEPSPARVVPGGRAHFRAIARDANGILLPDVTFRWSALEPKVGEIEFDGTLSASQELGEYPEAIQVEAIQPVNGQ